MPKPTATERFLSKVDKAGPIPNDAPGLGPCWEWTAFRNSWGYGMFRMSCDRSMLLAHRAAYELLIGEIPAGLELDHLCRNRGCVNPKHLEPVTGAENMRRSSLPERRGVYQAAKTRCPSGHPYNSANTYVTPAGHRQCRACRKTHRRTSRTKEVAGAAAHG